MTKFSRIFCVLIFSITSTHALADCAADAKSVTGGMINLPPFHIAIKTVSNGIESRMVGEVAMPDSFRLAFGNSAMVMTPRGAWALEKGKWNPQSAKIAANMRDVLFSGLTDGLSRMRNVKCNPKATVNGQVFKSIEFDTYKNQGDKNPLAHVNFLLNKKNQPLWMITKGFSAKGNSVIVQQFTYDPSIKIADPK